jgi:hypothetical protein
MPDVFLRSGEASPADVRLRDTTLADAPGSFTLAVAIGQAAATQSGSLVERFVITSAIAQAPGAISGQVAERFVFAAAASQARATVSAALREDFVLAAVASSQAAATIGAALTVVDASRTLAIAVVQAKASLAGVLTSGEEEAGAGGFGPIRRRLRTAEPLDIDIVVPPLVAAAVSVTQPAPSIAAVLEQREDEAWLLLDELALVA